MTEDPKANIKSKVSVTCGEKLVRHVCWPSSLLRGGIQNWHKAFVSCPYPCPCYPGRHRAERGVIMNPNPKNTKKMQKAKG